MRIYVKFRESEMMKIVTDYQWSNRRAAVPNLSGTKPRPFLRFWNSVTRYHPGSATVLNCTGTPESSRCPAWHPHPQACQYASMYCTAASPARMGVSSRTRLWLECMECSVSGLVFAAFPVCHRVCVTASPLHRCTQEKCITKQIISTYRQINSKEA